MSLGQAVDTNVLEWESRKGKINSKTSKIIRSGNRYKWMIVLMLLLIIPTFDSHFNSFVYIVWPNYFTSLTVNLPHTWLNSGEH
jgi:hypothetical protein